ncbi:hypothetical protein CEE69_24060 [Rhodopirellula bahusiensis]|uniref:Uncharacterized protein n=1 Tax=Rhodopirellula bahusiensis TaxID=2014065 RepID=A0A2G1W1Y8_9BACT|nr:hypothetical protein CEE69_24060 [Rhodopirellula bahusiensis]
MGQLLGNPGQKKLLNRPSQSTVQRGAFSDNGREKKLSDGPTGVNSTNCPVKEEQAIPVRFLTLLKTGKNR